MNESRDFLGTESIGKLLLKLSLPAVAAQLVNMLYNIVDRIYIGRIPEVGDLALTGLGVCMPLILIVSAFAALVSMGGAPRASIFLGKQQEEEAEKIMGASLAFQLLVSAVLTVVLCIWNEDMLLAFGASENTIGYAAGYMGIYALGTVFVQVTLGMNAFISAQGYAKVSMWTVLIGAVCNIVLDPLFIFVFKMGVRGAALATVLSQAVSMLWVLRFLTGERSRIRLRRKTLRLDLKTILPCVALGLAPFIMQSTESILSVCFNSSLLKYGGDMAVGAMTILTSVMQFAMLPMQGIAQGAQPISSYNFGAGNAQRVKQTFWLLVRCTTLYSFVLWALVMLFPGFFAGIFTPKPELIAFTRWALRIYCGALCLMGIQIACQMTFISLGNALSSMVVAIMRKFVLLIPLIYILPLMFTDKTMAVYLAEPVADVLAVTFTAVLFAFQFRKALRGMCDSNKAAEE
jgi:putative MATE family efflux protein